MEDGTPPGVGFWSRDSDSLFSSHLPGSLSSMLNLSPMMQQGSLGPHLGQQVIRRAVSLLLSTSYSWYIEPAAFMKDGGREHQHPTEWKLMVE
jgi:hypothetical protein